MGALLSAFTLFIDWRILGLAFGITAGTFLIMTLIAVLSKGNLSGLGIAGFGLLIGAGILALFNWWMMFLLPSVWNTLYWIITFAVFAATAAAVTLASGRVDDPSQHVHQCHGHNAEHYNRLYDSSDVHNS
jgi:FtsH-binding integral membrane protein